MKEIKACPECQADITLGIITLEEGDVLVPVETYEECTVYEPDSMGEDDDADEIEDYLASIEHAEDV